jgi:hypothetical protein
MGEFFIIQKGVLIKSEKKFLNIQKVVLVIQKGGGFKNSCLDR